MKALYILSGVLIGAAIVVVINIITPINIYDFEPIQYEVGLEYINFEPYHYELIRVDTVDTYQPYFYHQSDGIVIRQYCREIN